MLNIEDVRKADAREKPYKLFDASGLYLLVTTGGSRLWRFKYRFAKKEKTLALGRYPDVRLAVARQKRDEARRLIAEEGIDPGEKRKAEKAARVLANEGTLKAIAEEWLVAGCLSVFKQMEQTKRFSKGELCSSITYYAACR